MHLRLNTELLSGLFGLALTALFFFNRGDVGFLSFRVPEHGSRPCRGNFGCSAGARFFFCRGTNHAVIRRCRLCADRGWCDGGVVAWHQACPASSRPIRAGPLPFSAAAGVWLKETGARRTLRQRDLA